MKILIVDDDFVFLETLSLFLKEEGHEVFPASDCHQALKVLETVPAELIISDVMMPGMSGLDLLGLLKQFYMKNVPVIVVSSNPDFEKELEAEDMGAVEFLTKPIDMKKLLQLINGTDKSKVA